MAITRRQLVEAFGTACDNGSAALFVGAGMSRAAGLPDWTALLDGPRRDANVPYIEHDLPLQAEYIIESGGGSVAQLRSHMLKELAPGGINPTDNHRALARIPVDQVWTTNYDDLLESALSDATVIATDSEVQRIGSTLQAVIKMHGSIGGSPPRWLSDPVISRTDYEKYETDHPRMWSLLRAAYLSKAILFLGFSFADPNVEILQRLARLYGTAADNRHMTILRRPDGTDSDKLQRYELFVADLERSGVRVHEIADHSDLAAVLEALVRRTRPARYFVAGSPAEPDQDVFDRRCDALAEALSSFNDWELCSCGDAGWRIARRIGNLRQGEGGYDASKLTFHFRRKDEEPPPLMNQRIGTAVFSDLEREPLVKGLVDESRALIIIGGGDRTREEVQWATTLGLGIIPIAASGGAALDHWNQYGSEMPVLGGQEANRAAWERLNASDPVIVARAAAELLAQAMYR